MMRLKIEIVGNGLHPNEAVVGIKTNEGPQRLVISRRSIDDGFIAVGWPLGHQDKTTLVELPRETQTGAWRVWVPDDQLIQPEERKRA
ncbi:hypothetical protein [Bradyrhizobium sp. dw_411]|uniref:hypothetical protein n=1 Tax=Bradyrhizobium sp. dw_411 TaxID=2720082 RepID=UPI001BD0BF91|nr:hypothetical protein [Bradyrhizobium sp. dw_411]